MPVPPRIVRRVLFPPLLLALTALVVVALPLLVPAAAVAGRVRGLRLLWLLLVYLACECAGLLAALGLWVRAGLGARLGTPAMQAAHHRLLARLVVTIYDLGVRGLGVAFDHEQVDAGARRPEDSRRPLLVFCRHAGPGDSFLLLHDLVTRLGRRPRIVLKDVLQYDPCLDVLLNRLPNRFVSPQRSEAAAGDAAVAAIGDLAEGMDGRDALLLFPEGGNFTERRRVRAIARLRARGHHAQAEAAARMVYVLAPRPGGALASIAATPDTDILLVAHTGLEHLDSLADLWRGLPLTQRVQAGWWLEPEEALPAGHDDRIRWLYDRWADMDRWIAANRAP